MTQINEIGIARPLDWARVKKLLAIGVFASLLHLAGDLLLGWGVENEALAGLPRLLSAYSSASDARIFLAALLGLLGMTLEELCFFGIYRLIAPRSMKLAHSFRSGVFGYLMFGACGYHVPVCALVFLQKHGLSEALLEKYALYFLLSALALFWIFFLVLEIAQIRAFASGQTPYPKWCWVFSLPVGMAAALLPSLCGNLPWANAALCAWIAVGNLWMFGGLLALLPKAKTSGGQPLPAREE